jgi:hypothetical protein
VLGGQNIASPNNLTFTTLTANSLNTTNLNATTLNANSLTATTSIIVINNNSSGVVCADVVSCGSLFAAGMTFQNNTGIFGSGFRIGNGYLSCGNLTAEPPGNNGVKISDKLTVPLISCATISAVQLISDKLTVPLISCATISATVVTCGTLDATQINTTQISASNIDSTKVTSTLITCGTAFINTIYSSAAINAYDLNLTGNLNIGSGSKIYMMNGSSQIFAVGASQLFNAGSTETFQGAYNNNANQVFSSYSSQTFQYNSAQTFQSGSTMELQSGSTTLFDAGASLVINCPVVTYHSTGFYKTETMTHIATISNNDTICSISSLYRCKITCNEGGVTICGNNATTSTATIDQYNLSVSFSVSYGSGSGSLIWNGSTMTNVYVELTVYS